MPWKPSTHAQRTRGRTDTDLEYERRRRADPALRQAQRIRNSARWQRFRNWFKRGHPLCCDPFGRHADDGVVVATAHAHHITSLTARPDLACVASNCAPLCSRCHAKVEAMERAGKATRHLFNGRGGQISGAAPPHTARLRSRKTQGFPPKG